MSDGEPPGQPCPRAEMLDAMAASGMPVEVPDTIPSQISDMSPEDGEAMRAELIQLANDMLLARAAAVNATTNAAAMACLCHAHLCAYVKCGQVWATAPRRQQVAWLAAWPCCASSFPDRCNFRQSCRCTSC